MTQPVICDYNDQKSTTHAIVSYDNDNGQHVFTSALFLDPPVHPVPSIGSSILLASQSLTTTLYIGDVGPNHHISASAFIFVKHSAGPL